MRTHFARALCLSVSVLLLSRASLRAQNNAPAIQTYRAGLKSIAIPPPTSDLIETGPDYRVLFEPFAPAGNRLIAAFVLPDDMTIIRAGQVANTKQYALVEVLRRAEFATLTPDLFKQIADTAAAQFGADVNATFKDQQDDLNRRLKEINGAGAASVNLDKPAQLGLLFSKPDACGFGMIMPVSAKGITLKMIVAIVYMRVQERLIYSALYTEYKDDSSVQWARKTAEDWAGAILAANKP